MEENYAENIQNWQIPSHDIIFWDVLSKPYCVVIPVINEGERIRALLKKIAKKKIYKLADVIIVDGGSTDDSLEINFLKSLNVRGLLIKRGPGKLSAQLRCAYAFAMKQGYDGIITIDGNNKDDPNQIPFFIEKLKEGIDFIQASRFLSEYKDANTPRVRLLAIRWIHAPLLAFSSGFAWTDTTQGFRGYSKRLILDKRLNLFRDVFSSYELLSYVSYRAPKLGFRCLEIPARRCYPNSGKVPTKISPIIGNIKILMTLFLTCLGWYNPK